MSSASRRIHRKLMRQTISAYIDRITTTLLLIIAGLTPLLFLPNLSEFFEIPKLSVLSITTLILVTLWALSWVLRGKVLLTRTPLDLPLLLLLIVVLLSTFFSATRFPAIFGNFPRVHDSAIAWVTYILFFFVAASHLRTIGQVKSLFYVLFGSGVIVSIISLLSFLGVYLPLSFAKNPNFTPTGSAFSTIALLSLLLPLPLVSILQPNKYLPRIPAIVLSIIFAITIILLGDIYSYLIASVGIVITLLVTKRSEVAQAFPHLLIVAAAIVIALVASYGPIPGNIIQQKKASLTPDLRLGFASSWKVSVSAFRDSPFLGTGPGTYLFDFTQYKGSEHNSSRFWNVRFDNAHNQFLQNLATLGSLGFLALLFLSLIIISFSWRSLLSPDAEQNEWNNALTKSLAISSLVGIAIFALHASTLVSIVSTLIILAMLMATQKGIRGKVQELSLGIKASSLGDQNLIVGDALPIIIFIPVIILSIFGFWNATSIIRADYHHRLALNSANQRGIDVYNNLVAAERLNPRIDQYRTDLALTNFALANSIAAAKAPTEASPGGSLTDEDRQTIRQLLSQSINEGRAAVTLNPLSAGNWEVVGSIYRQISGVAQNALQFSLDAYGRAIQRDPLNPILRLNVGGIYYSVRNYDLAIRFFSDAVNLKPDYANAYYNLSVALRDKGDLASAQAAGERVVQLLQADTNSPDYKTASQYLADLKARIATGSANEAGTVPPAAQQTSPLQNQQLPNVVDLEGNPRTATPSAIPQNPNNPVRTSPAPGR